jgi:hypothetical protein
MYADGGTRIGFVPFAELTQRSQTSLARRPASPISIRVSPSLTVTLKKSLLPMAHSEQVSVVGLGDLSLYRPAAAVYDRPDLLLAVWRAGGCGPSEDGLVPGGLQRGHRRNHLAFAPAQLAPRLRI